MLFNESMEKLEQLYEDGGIDQELYEYLKWSMSELKKFRYGDPEQQKIRLEGKRFGMLEVLEEVMPGRTPNGAIKRMWLCQCDCGNTVVVNMFSLKENRLCSCGCQLETPDYIGQRFGRLVVIGEGEKIRDSNGHKRGTFVCQCDCGNTITVNRRYIVRGQKKSCGCINREIRERQARLKEWRTKYVKPEYKKLRECWQKIKQRCYNSNERNYKYYGGRGIKMCPEWIEEKGMYVFCEWALNNGYQDNLSIDRIDVDGDYTPENCRWIPLAEQQRNKSTTRYIEYKGETRCMAEWAEILNVDYDLLCARLSNGWTMEEAVTIPKGQHRKRA